MRKIAAILLAFVLLAVSSLLIVSADDEPIPLIHADDIWEYTDNGGCRVTMAVEGDDFVFSGSTGGTWPATQTTYQEAISVPVDEYALHYDFDVESGNTNITFRFNYFSFPISNTSLGDIRYESGSGDLEADHYEGTVRLKDFVNSTTNLNGSSFDLGQIDDGMLTFTGIQIYSVSGATITVHHLELVKYEGGDEPDEPSEEPVESSEEPAESAETSVVKDESKAEESKGTDESAAASEGEITVSEDSAANGEETSSGNRILGLAPWAFILLCVAVVCVVAVAVIILVKK